LVVVQLLMSAGFSRLVRSNWNAAPRMEQKRLAVVRDGTEAATDEERNTRKGEENKRGRREKRHDGLAQRQQSEGDEVESY